ncbi:NAD-dependent epimerase/dehydratase family protein [Mycolicibacterium mucogenicum]|uniref:NAD(P)-dependent oxidoreductase n=1 Tax=Mycolicibacterium mucogenicum TaxID=56689 RepID=A0A4R5WIT2_MYCMU|nr:NAD(P)-dependent oxidoreductase [Mycolicibacterium mucogenicum]TDK90571.1 NAD(P)-dependent oxidoreductase [Mycolicibacterium mucogenicum]
MRVFVTGGTGAIGVHTVPALVAAGHAVTALARSDAKAAWLQSQGAAPVAASLFDRRGLADAFAGHDVVVNLASALPSTTTFIRKSAWTECEKVRVEGSAAVVDAARDAGVPKLIQESVMMIYRDGGTDWVDEQQPVDHYPITHGNHAAEASARRFATSGGNASILRFGVFYGPHAAHSEQILDMAKWHIGFFPGRSDTYLSSIHVADAASAVVAALTTPGGTYNIVDDQPLTKREYAEACAAAVGRRIWISGPGRLGLLLGDRLTSMTRSLRVSNKRFHDSSGWRPRHRSAIEGYRAMAQLR